MLTDKTSRREFLVDLGKKALTAGMLAPVISSGIMASGRSVPVPFDPIVLDLSKPEYAALNQVGAAIKVHNPKDKNKPIIVNRLSETEVAAFSSKCTHFGCEVGLPVNNVAACPCHGSHFDGSGKVTKGPAGKNLYAFMATLEGGVITIKEKNS